MARTYEPAVERWRPLVEQYFHPADVDKALWVIKYESSGYPHAVGDGGASVGLFQLNDNGLGAGMSVAQRRDPEANIRRAAQAVYGGQGWAPWGENNLYNGRVFGSLGHHPYPGGAGVNGRAPTAQEGDIFAEPDSGGGDGDTGGGSTGFLPGGGVHTAYSAIRSEGGRTYIVYFDENGQVIARRELTADMNTGGPMSTAEDSYVRQLPDGRDYIIYLDANGNFAGMEPLLAGTGGGGGSSGSGGGASSGTTQAPSGGATGGATTTQPAGPGDDIYTVQEYRSTPRPGTYLITYRWNGSQWVEQSAQYIGPGYDYYGETPSGPIPNSSLEPGTNEVLVPSGAGIPYGRFNPNYTVYVPDGSGGMVELRPGMVAPGGEWIRIDVPGATPAPPPAGATGGGAGGGTGGGTLGGGGEQDRVVTTGYGNNGYEYEITSVWNPQTQQYDILTVRVLGRAYNWTGEPGQPGQGSGIPGVDEWFAARGSGAGQPGTGTGQQPGTGTGQQPGTGTGTTSALPPDWQDYAESYRDTWSTMPANARQSVIQTFRDAGLTPPAWMTADAGTGQQPGTGQPSGQQPGTGTDGTPAPPQEPQQPQDFRPFRITGSGAGRKLHVYNYDRGEWETFSDWYIRNQWALPQWAQNVRDGISQYGGSTWPGGRVETPPPDVGEVAPATGADPRRIRSNYDLDATGDHIYLPTGEEVDPHVFYNIDWYASDRADTPTVPFGGGTTAPPSGTEEPAPPQSQPAPQPEPEPQPTPGPPPSTGTSGLPEEWANYAENFRDDWGTLPSYVRNNVVQNFRDAGLTPPSWMTGAAQPPQPEPQPTQPFRDPGPPPEEAGPVKQPGATSVTGTNTQAPSPGILNSSLSPGQNVTRVPAGGGIAYDRFDPRFDIYVLDNSGGWRPLQPGETAPGGARLRIDVPGAPSTSGMGQQPARTTQQESSPTQPFGGGQRNPRRVRSNYDLDPTGDHIYLPTGEEVDPHDYYSINWYAQGGETSATRPFVVGEPVNGQPNPELVIPQKDGDLQIIPFRHLQGFQDGGEWIYSDPGNPYSARRRPGGTSSDMGWQFPPTGGWAHLREPAPEPTIPSIPSNSGSSSGNITDPNDLPDWVKDISRADETGWSGIPSSQPSNPVTETNTRPPRMPEEEVGPVKQPDAQSTPGVQNPPTQQPVSPSPGIPNSSLDPGQNVTRVPEGGGIAYDRFDPNYDIYLLDTSGGWRPLQPGETAPGGAKIRIDVPQPAPPDPGPPPGSQPTPAVEIPEWTRPFSRADDYHWDGNGNLIYTPTGQVVPPEQIPEGYPRPTSPDPGPAPQPNPQPQPPQNPQPTPPPVSNPSPTQPFPNPQPPPQQQPPSNGGGQQPPSNGGGNQPPPNGGGSQPPSNGGGNGGNGNGNNNGDYTPPETIADLARNIRQMQQAGPVNGINPFSISFENLDPVTRQMFFEARRDQFNVPIETQRFLQQRMALPGAGRGFTLGY